MKKLYKTIAGITYIYATPEALVDYDLVKKLNHLFRVESTVTMVQI